MTAWMENRPVLRWAGSKRKLLPVLASFWRDHYLRYVEPFAGSACLFFALRPKEALVADNNSELIDLYKVLRASPVKLHRRLSAIPRDRHTYDRWRSMDPRSLDRGKRALRFLYLNRNCFNGIYRTNVRGLFNVPFGRNVGGNPSRWEMQSCAMALESADLSCGDFRETLKKVRKGDFVYLDPPYFASSRRIFREYGAHPFGSEDIPDLAEELRRIDRKKATFLVSYADSKEARLLAKDWHSTKVRTRRHVAGFAGDRALAFEWLLTNGPLRKGE